MNKAWRAHKENMPLAREMEGTLCSAEVAAGGPRQCGSTQHRGVRIPPRGTPGGQAAGQEALERGSDATDTICAAKMHLSLPTFLPLSSVLLLGQKILQKQVITGQSSSPTLSNKKDKRVSNNSTSKPALKSQCFHLDAKKAALSCSTQTVSGSPPAFQHCCAPTNGREKLPSLYHIHPKKVETLSGFQHCLPASCIETPRRSGDGKAPQKPAFLQQPDNLRRNKPSLMSS